MKEEILATKKEKPFYFPFGGGTVFAISREEALKKFKNLQKKPINPTKK